MRGPGCSRALWRRGYRDTVQHGFIVFKARRRLLRTALPKHLPEHLRRSSSPPPPPPRGLKSPRPRLWAKMTAVHSMTAALRQQHVFGRCALACDAELQGWEGGVVFHEPLLPFIAGNLFFLTKSAIANSELSHVAYRLTSSGFFVLRSLCLANTARRKLTGIRKSQHPLSVPAYIRSQPQPRT